MKHFSTQNHKRQPLSWSNNNFLIVYKALSFVVADLECGKVHFDCDPFIPESCPKQISKSIETINIIYKVGWWYRTRVLL